MTHRTSDELRDSLRSKLSRLVGPMDGVEDADIIDSAPVTAEDLDSAWDE